ncbi:phage fiber-tail adaptor protein [Mycobacterium sp. C3-094]
MAQIKWVVSDDGTRVRLFEFHPGEVLEFTLGWDKRLADDDRLTSARFEIDSGAGIELFSPTNTTHRAQVWARGNPPLGAEYTLVCHATTAMGRQLRQSVKVQVTAP